MCALKDQAGGLACRRRAGGRLEVGDVAPPEVNNEAAGGMSIGAASLSLPCDFLVRGMSVQLQLPVYRPFTTRLYVFGSPDGPD